MYLEEGGTLEELPEGSIEGFRIEGSLLDLIRCEIWLLILFSNAIKRYRHKLWASSFFKIYFQKSGGAYQSPLLKTFSTTSRDSFYDYEDPLTERYDDTVKIFYSLKMNEIVNI